MLVVSQVALSLLMLIAAALFTRSLHNLKNVDLGFRRERLLSFALDPSLAGYKAERIRQFAEDVQTRVAATVPCAVRRRRRHQCHRRRSGHVHHLH